MKRRDQMIVLLAVTGLLVFFINLFLFNPLARLKLFSAPKGFPSAELRPVGTEPIRIDSLTKCSYIRLPAFKVLDVGGSQNYGGATWRGGCGRRTQGRSREHPQGQCPGNRPGWSLLHRGSRRFGVQHREAVVNLLPGSLAANICCLQISQGSLQRAMAQPLL